MLYYKQLGVKPDYTQTYNKLLKSDYGYAKLYNFLALKYSEIKMHEYAAILFKKAIEIHPSNIQYYANLCAAYGDSKKFKKAIEIGKKAIELEPNSANAHYNLSVAYYFDGEHNLALRHIEIAEKLGFKPGPEFLRILQTHKIKEAGFQ
jgi:tetratricopeptide (TPR) repeat protein